MNYGDSLYIIIVIAKIKNITPSKHLHPYKAYGGD